MNCTTKTPLADFFAPSGLLARHFKEYEYRPQQLELTIAVEDFLRHPSQSVMAAEAPPGVGKTFAVLIPAILRAREEGKRILFLTAGIALQEQLIEKDLPRLTSLLGGGTTFGALKGRGNYICLRKAAPLASGFGSLFPTAGEGAPPDLSRWIEETGTGDLAELSLAAGHPLYFEASAGFRNCLGTACPFRERCFVIRSFRRAQEWNVVVANYHLYFSHLLGPKGSFPVAYDWLICDEAHRIPDAVRGASTVEATVDEGVSLLRPRTLSPFEPLFAGQGINASLFKERAADCRKALDAVFSLAEIRCRQGEAIPARDEELFHKAEELVAELNKLLSMLRALEDRFMSGGFENSSDLGEAAAVIGWLDRVNAFKDALLWCLKVDHWPEWSYWRGGGCLVSAPVACADIIRNSLDGESPEKSLMISATLTLGGDFSFWSRETGISPQRTLAVESPFDFKNHMELLIVDIGLSVGSHGYDERICRVIRRLCDENGGRSLVLLSSMRLLRALSALMRERACGYEVLVQGDLPQRELLKRFRDEETSVLIGSVSFREGVDIPGEGLTQVIIDRIPFPHPNDPLVQARNALEGQRAFATVTLPNARMFLRQAAGRLIRGTRDHGRVALLDGRALDRKEWKILDSFPLCKCQRLVVRG